MTEWFWSAEDDAFLVENAASLCIRELARRLGCSYKAVAGRLMRLDVHAAPERVPGGSWTPERIERATALWRDGLSASQIAKQLGGVSRNAVIGKVHRFGLAKRAAASHPHANVKFQPRPSKRDTNAASGLAKRQRPVAARRQTPPAFDATAATGTRTISIQGKGRVMQLGPVAPLPKPRLVEPHPRQKTILHRLSSECAWAICAPRDQADAGTLFCCKPVAQGAFCAEHALIVYPNGLDGKADLRSKELVRSLRRLA